MEKPHVNKIKVLYKSFMHGRDLRQTAKKFSIAYTAIIVTGFCLYKLYDFTEPSRVELEAKKLLRDREDVQSLQVEEA